MRNEAQLNDAKNEACVPICYISGKVCWLMQKHAIYSPPSEVQYQLWAPPVLTTTTDLNAIDPGSLERHVAYVVVAEVSHHNNTRNPLQGDKKTHDSLPNLIPQPLHWRDSANVDLNLGVARQNFIYKCHQGDERKAFEGGPTATRWVVCQMIANGHTSIWMHPAGAPTLTTRSYPVHHH